MSDIILVGFMVGLSIFSFIFTIFAMKYAFDAKAEVIGLRSSTHQIQYVPVDDKGPSGEELVAQAAEAYGYDAKVINKES